MKQINENQINNEIELLKGIAKIANIVNNKMKTELLKNGYSEICLGTGRQSYSSSRVIKIWELNNTYKTGKFVGMGVSSMKHGKGNRYFAYVKEII